MQKLISFLLMPLMFTNYNVRASVEPLLVQARQQKSVDLYEIRSDRNEFLEQFHINEKLYWEEVKRIEEELEKQRLEELEKLRIEEEQRKLEESKKIYCKFEVSFYTPSADENGGYAGITASGEKLQPWISVALPKDIPFYSDVYIEGLGNFINHDTGGYIQWTTDNQGNKVCRIDVCVNTKEEAYKLGRYYADGYIKLK